MRHAVILAGGRGVRLWPLSRRAQPKHVVKLFDGQSLLDLAIERARVITNPERVWICSNSQVRKHAGFEPARFIEEPCGRDTLAAIALSSAVISAKDADAVIVVLTADHLINPVDRLAELINTGCDVAESAHDIVVTFSIKPTSADTGYGYIERGDHWPGFEKRAFTVAQYIEKPNARDAARFIAGGRHGWSSGMFAFRADLFLDLVEQIDPGSGAVLRAIGQHWGTMRGNQLAGDWYNSVKQTSVDFAIMMPASRGELKGARMATVPLDVNWIDVGTFERLAEVRSGDENGNTTVGPCELADCRNLITVTGSDAHRIAAIGCEDLVIVHTQDVTFVCPRDRIDDLKDFVSALDEQWT